MVRLLMGSVGRYEGGDSLPSTVWEGRRFGPFGEFTWWGPTLVFVVSSILGVERHFQMLKAPNYYFVVALLSFLVAIAMCALRIWVAPSRPAKGRYRPQGHLAEKLTALGDVWLTDEPELNPKRSGSAVVLNERVAEELSHDQLKALVCRLESFSGIYRFARAAAEALHPGTLGMWISLFPGPKALPNALLIVGPLVVISFGMTVLKYRIPLAILKDESQFDPAQREWLAQAYEQIFRLAGLVPDKFTQIRIENLRQSPSVEN